VTKKFTELTIEAFKTINIPANAISVRPIAVYRVRDENGVITAQPGIKSFALRSIAYTKPSSLLNRLYNVF
jgi:hypothetical protein